MKAIFSICIALSFLPIKANAQAGDFIVVRKHGQSIRTFLKGSYVRFITTSGEWIECRIQDIHSDSLFFREVIVRQIPTQWGVTRSDTIATPLRAIRYNEIGAVPRSKEGFTYIKNGTLLMIGGAGYILLNLVNGAYLHYPPFGKKNLPGIATATGVFGAGFLMKKHYRPYLLIQKKYTVEYIKVTGSTL